MQNIKKILGDNIKRLRLRLKLTQEKFAEIIKVDAKMVSKIETGQSFTTAETLEDICKSCNITPDKLFKINYNIEEYDGDSKDKQQLIDDFIKQLKALDNETLKFLLKVNCSILNNYDRRKI